MTRVHAKYTQKTPHQGFTLQRTSLNNEKIDGEFIFNMGSIIHVSDRSSLKMVKNA